MKLPGRRANRGMSTRAHQRFTSWATISLAAALAITWCSAACAEWHSQTEAIMGTEVQVTLWSEDTPKGKAQAQHAIAAVMTEMRRIDTTYSPYIKTSKLAALNRLAAKTPQKVGPEMWALLKRAKHFHALTQGAFDITFASVGWHYDYRAGKAPSEAQTQSLLPAINSQWVAMDELEHTVAYKHKNVRVDLGGIAKGYAVDQAIAILRGHGIQHATVSAGGDSRILGDKRGSPWLVGIKHPRLPANADTETVMTLPLSDVAVSTSGDYERYFINDKGERIHHILNPKTGKPTKGIMSVTVIGPQGINTDALSTSVFVLGVEKGLAVIHQLDNYDCIIITSDGQVHYSQGLTEPEVDKPSSQRTSD